MPMSPRLLRPTASRSGIGFDADAATYIRAVEAADGQALEPVVGVAINNFVVGCKADGIWSAIKASCILMGARTPAGALTPLVGAAPTNNGPFVSGDYTRGGATPGLKGNGSTKFLNSNRADNADGQNDAHRAVWVTALPANLTTDYRHYYGTQNTPITDHYNLPVGGVTEAIRSRGSTVTVGGTVRTTGFKGHSRPSSASFSWRTNGLSGSLSAASSAPTSASVIVFGNGQTDARNDGRIAFYSIGTSLDLALLESRVSTLVSAMATVT